ncbi:uncharacterized protein CC84DRAFT_1084743 [Paraphaeosphaeria sporulosa]|uniref:Uncharacterized protein n=1 Tax=Paraphaeosphaeria sporulosa TaxID=1460663 RepID=A0A177CTY6_9PLEO|nr:uncharacterized protein CC84DRAFT_1084743 [Paraphaeosphaeria sporulosa]OAG10382.1 hypothetical protein CC84DRAFT_1084743 [Paraphaeosphaeria sporulosa]
MSWNYTVNQINLSFERIAQWYQDFLRRSEAAFRALHDRVLVLEQQQASQGPSDEQVERVLRKILAERFGDTSSLRVENPSQIKDVDFFVKPPDDNIPIPRAPLIDPAMLFVDPEAVPSKAYSETFQMLERGLSQYPQIDDAKPVIRDATPKEEDDFKPPGLPPNHGRPW